MYALGRLAALEGASLLGLLYWQAMSSAIIVSTIALLWGSRPRFSMRCAPHCAAALMLGASPSLIASYRPIQGSVAGALVAALAALLLGGDLHRARVWPPGPSPLSVAGAVLIAQALVLDPTVAYAHDIVLPGFSFTRLDWILIGTSALSSAFYMAAFTLAARTPGWRYARCTT
jgi:hypothetical protein